MATKAERRNSTGNLHSEKPIDRLKREHFLNPDSDHVDLNLLLRAVLDINESLDAEESEAKDIAVNEQRQKCTEDQGIAKKPTKTDKFGSDTDSIRSSSMSISRTRPKSAVRYDDKRPPPPERKNMSFCNSRVDAIDRENLRLLQQISQRRQRPKSATVTKKSVSAPVRGQTSSQVNRQRFQQKVDMENQVSNFVQITHISFLFFRISISGISYLTIIFTKNIAVQQPKYV